ncbi:hypothetical protein [Dyadobacter pollutisoli]|uniref:Uncharacterized protein n=1 Tax=Dyadobacter pollutisoli TaxID=2910158 RepID=A0A9E8SJD0_9BACT|nr:hypothetical protein [Dyadobacter pollutisoli]WAC09586.1 hypothetical protein ON006_17685 [Dyadobacter pollutisoli]
MKTNGNSFIFAFIYGILVLALPQATMAKGSGDEQKDNIAVISNESEIEFTSYIGQVFPDFVKQENWSIINNIVTLYNQTPSKVRVASAEDINKFNAAVTELGSKLETINSPEALEWKSNLLETARVVRFVRNFDLNTLSVDQNEINTVKVPNSFVNF